MGMTFPVSIQDKEINALLDTGAEKSYISIDMSTRLKLSINVERTSKLRNTSGKDMKTHGVMKIKFKMGNTIFVQDFIICEDLVRPIIIGRDFTVSNFIGIIWTKQGMKTLSMMRRIAIPPRQYAEFELECDELEGKFEVKPEPSLQQREPNLWMDSFVVYNVPEDQEEADMKGETKKQEMPIRNEDMQIVSYETREETKKVCIPYCIFNLSTATSQKEE